MRTDSNAATFVRYAIVGAISNSVAYGAFLGLVHIRVTAVYASGLCYAIALALGYVGNFFWAFRSESSHVTDIPRYLLTHAVGILFAMSSISIMLTWFRPAVAQLLTVVITAFVLYLTLLLVRFGRA